MTLSPIQSFFTQTQSGDSRWWTWVIGFWFAVIIWLIVSLGSQSLIMLANPDIFDRTIAEIQNTTRPPLKTALIYALIAFSPAIPIIFWFLRDSLRTSPIKQITIGISSLIILITTFGFLIAQMNPPEGAGEVMSLLISKNAISYALILATFPGFIGGIWLTQKFVHQRTFLSVITSAKKFRWGRMGFAMLVMWVILAGGAYIGHLTGASQAEIVFDPSRFWMYLPVTLLFIPLQSATEEIALRGYLNQGIGHYINNPWIVFVITSALFASLHLGNPEVAESTKDTSLIIAMSGYFLFGIFACVLTYIDGGLESAIGMHAANNIFAASLVGYDNSALPTPTVFKVPLNSELDTIVVLVSLTVICFIMYKTRKPLF